MEDKEKYEDQEMMYIPVDVRDSLKAYAEAERVRIGKSKGPIDFQRMITWKSTAIHILRNEVQKRGHYVGKKP